MRVLAVFARLVGVLYLVLGPVSPVAAANDTSPFRIPNSAIHSVRSDTLGRSYDLFVKTPLGYDDPENAGTLYPVIYLNDGPYTFQVASGVTHLPMGRSHKFDRAILVGISYAYGEHGMDSRVRDLTPIVDGSWKSRATGGAADYLEFIEDKIIPFVESHYRADPARRTLSGQSLGGLFGGWVLLTRPDIFSSYILTSPSLWYKKRYIFDLEEAYAGSHKDLPVKVYFAVGSEETVPKGMRNPMVSQLREFGESLKSRNFLGLELKIEIIPGALHETTFPQGFTRGMHWIFGRDNHRD